MCTSLNPLMRIALLLMAIDTAWVLFPAAAHAGSVAVLVDIDKTNQRMTVSVNGLERYEWPVSTGRAGYSTPSGTYTATSMNEIWYSKQWDNSPMPHSIFFIKDGHAIHGSFDVKNLGRPVSHGCVRISPKNAATLYALVKENGLENTRVVVTGVSPDGEYNVAEDETSPRRVRRSSGVSYYNGSQGYYRYNGSQGYYRYNGSQGWSYGSPWSWTPW
ncbi:MAG TPA: L,D-transpeptidase [Methylocella sp.]|nr:L,D-transpeptidase [Methylocella sp.]